jgi:hypothetical protein
MHNPVQIIMKGGHQMTKYREILRLLSNQLKTDEIVHACSVSKKTVIKVKKRARELGISWPLDADMTDEKLETLIVKVVVSKKLKSFVALGSSCLSGSTMNRMSCK